MYKGFGFLTAIGLILVSQGTFAADWNRQVELGAVFLSGNTEEDTIKFRGDFVRDSTGWKHHADIDYLRSNRDSELSAQKLYTSLKSDYKLAGDQFAFGRVSYEDDRFSGFDYQTDIGDSVSEGILRMSAAFDWQVSDNAEFEQKLSTEVGSDATISRSSTALKSQINGSLSMRLSFNVKHNSNPPGESEASDLETAVTFAYTF